MAALALTRVHGGFRSADGLVSLYHVGLGHWFWLEAGRIFDSLFAAVRAATPTTTRRSAP